MITVAKTAGFCYGVKRAVDGVYAEIEKGNKIATLGHLIHNGQVIAELEEKGVKSYERVSDIPPDCAVVIRAHGVGENVYKEIGDRQCIDLTCPFVSKIHKIVSEHYAKGYQIVIAGDKNHPEVIGINGHCSDSAVIINDKNYVPPPELSEKRLCIVAQTTINKDFFGEIVQNIKKTCKSTLIFDTICSATKDRQKEAEELSLISDMMIVIGGRESSNTRKLYEISKRNCPETYHVETVRDLPAKKTHNKIGITAGASTPGGIIEEVKKAMSENVKNEENFAELFEQYSSKTLNNGDIVEGTVVEVRSNEVIVDLGGFKYNGQLAADQLTNDPALKPSDVVKEGDTIKVYVVGVNDGEGKVVLSRKKVINEEGWIKIKEAYEEGRTLEGKITKAVKGGVIAITEDTQVFIPARQVSGRFVQDLQSLVGDIVNYKIIEIDERRKRVIGSVRVIIEAERKEKEAKFWAEAEVGKKYEGVVKSITSFGAFVDIGGVDGLVHISELSWNRIKHPSEVVKEGDVLEVYIKDINPETKKISLGYKKAEDNPWEIAKSKIAIGDIVKCKIVRMLPFGAFAEIIPNVDGLIHISQIADRKIGKPEDVLSIGQEVEAQVTDVNWDDKKISLSISALMPTKIVEDKKEEDEVPLNAETLVYSTNPDVEVDEKIEIEPAEEEAPAEEAPAEETPAAEEAPAEEAAPAEEKADDAE